MHLSRQQLTLFFLFLTQGFLLNFLWESVHAILLYRGLEIGVERYLSVMLRVSLVDMVWLGVVFVGLAVYFRNFFWFEKLSQKKLIALFLVPLIVAILIEVKGVFIFDQWSYNKMMPTIIGLGLSPLLQLPLTMFFSTLVTRAVKTR